LPKKLARQFLTDTKQFATEASTLSAAVAHCSRQTGNQNANVVATFATLPAIKKNTLAVVVFSKYIQCRTKLVDKPAKKDNTLFSAHVLFYSAIMLFFQFMKYLTFMILPATSFDTGHWSFFR